MLKTSRGNHVHRAHQAAYHARQCPRGGFPLLFLCVSGENSGGMLPMLCPQRRRIPSIIRAVSPCFTPPCIARRRERSRPPMLPSTLRGHHFVSDTSTHLTPLRANSPFLYDVLSPWRFGGQCRPTITRPYLLYYIYVVACGLKGLCGVSTLSRAAPFFLVRSLRLFYTSSEIILQIRVHCIMSRIRYSYNYRSNEATRQKF